MGGDEFKKKIFRSEEERSGEISGASLIFEEVPAHLIIEEVSKRFGIPVYDITEAKRGKGKKNIPRMVGMRLCQTLGRKKLSDIAKIFNVGHYSTVSSSIRILRKEVESNKKLQNLINILTQDLTRLFLITMNLHRKQKTLCQSVGKPSLFLTGTLRYDVGRNEVSHIDP